MGEILQEIQYKLKMTSSILALLLFKVLSGMILGVTLALIFQEILHYNTLSFVFVVVTTTAAFFRVSKRWRWIGVALFNLVCILLGLLLRMYILIAPGV